MIRPDNRPKDAQAVADGLTTYLHGVQERLQAVERERAVAVAREGIAGRFCQSTRSGCVGKCVLSTGDVD